MPPTKRSLTKHHLLTDDYYKRLRAYNRTSPPRTRLAKTMAAAASAPASTTSDAVGQKPLDSSEIRARPSLSPVQNLNEDVVDTQLENYDRGLIDSDATASATVFPSTTVIPSTTVTPSATVTPSTNATPSTAANVSMGDGIETGPATSDKTDEDLLGNIGQRYQLYAKKTLDDLRSKLPALKLDANYIIECPGTPLDGLSMVRLLHCASTPFARPDLPSSASDYLHENRVPLRNHLMQKDSPPEVPGWTCFYRQ